MSIQWNMGNGDQYSNKRMLEQLWYTWSAVGLGSLTAGFRIRAASQALSDVRSPRMLALDRYLRYVLPAGTDPFAITPDMAPICLSLIQTDQGEQILVNKTYTGKDGVGRPGAFFVHLLSNLPPDFSAAQAISLWRSPFLRSSDIDPSSGVQLSGVQLDAIPFSDLQQWLSREFDIMHPQGINSSWMHDCFPLVIRAYLMWRRRWEQWWQNRQSEPPRLYIAAPSDMVAAFISGITRCLPRQLLTELTFSTYEHDVRSRGQVLLVGTTWPPSPDGKINTNQDLPAACYQEGVAINCYNYDETKTRLERDPLAISFAAYATQCVAADNFEELDWLFREKTAQALHLDVSGFLQAYDSYIVKAQNPTQKDVELYLDNADAELLSRVHVQSLILTIGGRDSHWLNSFLGPHLAFLSQQSKANPKLARALAQLAKATTQKAAEAVSADDITILNAMLSIMVQAADNQSEAWRIQPRTFAALPNIQSFLARHPDTTFRLLELWNQLSPPLGINEVRPFLNVPERNFEAFYGRSLPLEWKYIATQALVTSVIAQGIGPVLGQKYRRPVADLMQHLSQTSWFEAVNLFEKLAKEGYPDKIALLSILLGAPTSAGKEVELLNKAYLKDSEREYFLLQYGPQYLRSSHTEVFILKLFKAFAKDVPNRKMFVLDNWLKSPSLLIWFEAPIAGPNNLDKVLDAASLGPDESNAFIENDSRRYLERFGRQSAYHPSFLISGYLKRYLASFNPKGLWQPSSSACEFLLFLGNSPLRQTLPEREQLKVQQLYSLGTFLRQPSTRIANLKVLGGVLRELGSIKDLLLIERLAEAFASCIESATELASVTYTMSTLITETELLQMLYTMAERVRDDMVDTNSSKRQRAVALLEPYIQLALCFDSVYDLLSEKTKFATRAEEMLPAIKEKLFLQTFLYILLQNAPQDLMKWLDEGPSWSRQQYWQKWAVYRPVRNEALSPVFSGSSLGPMQPARSIRQASQAHYDLGTFLAHPSTTRKELETLGHVLLDQLSMRNRYALENLAVAFTSCVESEIELTAVIQVLNRFGLKTRLLQILYAMAESIRDDLADSEKKQVAEARLELYIRFVLCFESVYEQSPDEYALFVRTFLNLLLQTADDSVLQKLNTKNWPDKLQQKWQTYMPQRYAAFSVSRNGNESRSSWTAGMHSPQAQESSPGMIARFSEWFTRPIGWLAEKVTNNRR